MSPCSGINRRTFLISLGASGLAAACGGGSGDGSSNRNGSGSSGSGSGGAPSPASSPNPASSPSGPSGSTAKVPLTIDATKTDLPANTPVYAYIVGEVKSTSGVVTQYRLDATGTPHMMSAADNTNAAGTFPGSNQIAQADAAFLQGNYTQTWADYSIPVSLTAPTIIDLGNLTPGTLPGLGTGTAAFSGRVYISVGVPRLPFSPIDSANYTAPVPWAFPGMYTLFDWIEFSYDSNSAFNGNTTQVDQFGFPLYLNGTPGGTQQGVFNRSRPAIFTAIAGLGSDFDQTVSNQASSAYPAGITALRAVSPKTVCSPGTYSGPLLQYFDTTIEAWYSTWQTTPLVTQDLATGAYSGIVESGVLNFYPGAYASLADLRASGQFSLFSVGTNATPGIPSFDVWQCANSLASGTDAEKNVQKMMAAAFNRGVMSSSLDDATCQNVVATFYPTGTTSNPWAQLFHELSTTALAYGFPYDDVCDQNPSIGLTNTQSITITIGKFFS